MLNGEICNNVEILSVSYNSYDSFCNKSWESILNQDCVQVTVVDNDSPDQSGKKIKEKFKKIRVFNLSQNIGYGRALNFAINNSDKRFVLVVNPDIKFDLNDLVKLVGIAKNDATLTRIWAPTLERRGCDDDYLEDVEYVSGAAMLLDTEQMEQFFDENIFLFFEETSLCKDVINSGGKIKLCPSVFFDHIGGASSDDSMQIECLKAWHFAWSRCYFMNKYKLFTYYNTMYKMYFEYKIQSIINVNSVKRKLYKVKSEGVRAFMQGRKAFDKNGAPFISDLWC